MNDFSNDLDYANVDREDSFWLPRYRKAFPAMIATNILPTNCIGQYLGIDRIIQLSSGVTLRIDEKLRRSNYNDILLEYISNDNKNTKGWIEKDLQIDYIAYAFENGLTYMLPWLFLKKCWGANKENWLKNYKEVRAENKGYTTVSVAIPARVLLDSLRDAMIVDLHN